MNRDKLIDLLRDAQSVLLASKGAYEALDALIEADPGLGDLLPGLGYIKARSDEILGRIEEALAGGVLEIERKWLVDSTWVDLVWLDTDYQDSVITQTYLVPEDAGVSERVRRRDGMGWVRFTHTIKTPTDHPARRQEAEREVTQAEYEELLERADPDKHPVIKTRRVFQWEGCTWELDQLHGPVRVALLECELPSLDTEVVLPPWLPVLKEVTDDPAWTNAALADGKVPEDA